MSEIPQLPLRLFEETLPTVKAWPDAPCFFLRLSDAYESEAKAAEAMGWPTARLDANHLSILTSPSEVARAILALVQS